ncbi:MAG: DEAD/DEAH box helicase [Chloroflexi bacterium]|nr:DEAD/DEAH box helicase [Chloroflexota bacterium]
MNANQTSPEKKAVPFAAEIAYHETVNAVDPSFTPIPAFISSETMASLSQNGINMLFRHQAEALIALHNNEHIILSTGTASGKSLVYQIQILEMINSSAFSTALLMFPTKALERDQVASLLKFIPNRREILGVYDGDTPSASKRIIRQNARILFTNPDMLHHGLLPYHPSWADFFANLKIVIIDEAHGYRGVFGAHTANVIRRLKRIVAHYQGHTNELKFILASATLSNAATHAKKMISAPVTEISRDFSGNGSREIYFLNPPIVNEELHLRAGSIHTAARMVKMMKDRQKQTLLFTQSRQSVETAVRRLRDLGIDVDGYRSGYLPSERRKIEKGLKEGAIKCVAATNALELGMDIGGMDTVISIGYPGTIASYYQRMGRAGRNLRPSEFYLVASQNPIDQYLIKHPEFIGQSRSEPALIDPDNLLILFQHLQCALFELPFKAGTGYGKLSPGATAEILDYFCEEGIAHRSNDHYYWSESDRPQREVSLRNSSLDRIAIYANDLPGRRNLIGEIDRPSSYWMIHEGAIYFHNGVGYKILELNLEENSALAENIVPSYTTDALKNTTITVNQIIEQRQVPNGKIYIAEITVQNQVTGFQKRDIETGQLLGIFPLDLPVESLETKAFIVRLSETLKKSLEEQALWTNNENDYGIHWEEIRKNILSRDRFACTVCGQPGTLKSLHVHHIVPFRRFSDIREANDEKNLTTLCPTCHHKVETTLRLRSGLSGFGHAFHQIAALFVECDANDIASHPDQADPDFDSAPVLYLYETIQGGIGLSQSIFKNFESILTAVEDLIQNCECEDGCPGCVGPAGELGIGGKSEALAIVQGLLVNQVGL